MKLDRDAKDFGVGERKHSNSAIFALAAISAILAIIYVFNAGEPARLDRQIFVMQKKLRDTKNYIAEHYDELIGDEKNPQNTPGEMKKEPILTTIKNSTENVGLTNYLAGVAQEENKKLGEVTAKVTFRGIKLSDLVNFLVYVRSNYPGVTDRECQMRLARRQQGDKWDAFVSLTAKAR